MRSLLAPLLIGLMVSLAVVFGVQWSAVHVAIDAMIKDFIVGELTQDVDELHSALSVLPGGETALAIAHFDPAFLSPSSGRYYQVMAGREVALRSASLVGDTLRIRPARPGERYVDNVAGPRGQVLLLSASGFEVEGRQVTVAVGTDLKPIESEMDLLMTRYTQVSVLMFLILLVLQAAIVRLVLTPLRRVRADVRLLEQGAIAQLGERVPVEILPLVREVNRLVALLTRRLQRSRDSLGNLAHALKAPLTVLTHIAADEHVRRDPELARQLTEQLGILRSRIDSELRRARVAGGRAPGVPLDLGREIAALVATLRKLHRDRDLDIVARVDAGMLFHGDREDLLELCGNLLDNACKWATKRVVVTARMDDGMLLAIEDDGPGCTPEELGRIAQRGVRLDESVAGHGLGLAIAGSIAASYGTELRFGRSAALGGFAVTVKFPVESGAAAGPAR